MEIVCGLMEMMIVQKLRLMIGQVTFPSASGHGPTRQIKLRMHPPLQ